MTPYDATELARLVEQVRSTGRGRSNHAKGMAMADLVAHLFGQVPGVELRHREFIDPDHSSEIDLVFRNQPQVSGLFNGVTLLAECKNEARKISAAEVRIFGSKLGERNQPVGVMISRMGLSGRPGDKTTRTGMVALQLAQLGALSSSRPSRELAGLCDSSQLVTPASSDGFELEVFREPENNHRIARGLTTRCLVRCIVWIPFRPGE